MHPASSHPIHRQDYQELVPQETKGKEIRSQGWQLRRSTCRRETDRELQVLERSSYCIEADFRRIRAEDNLIVVA